MTTTIQMLDHTRDWETLTDEERRMAIFAIRLPLTIEEVENPPLPCMRYIMRCEVYSTIQNGRIGLCFQEAFRRWEVPFGLDFLDWAAKEFGSIGLWSTPLMTNSKGTWHCDCGSHKGHGNTSKDALWAGVYRAWQEKAKEANH